MPVPTQHHLIAALLGLKLPNDDYVVFGSGPLLNYGMRNDVSDIDVLARGRAWVVAGLLADRTVPGPYSGAPIHQFWGGQIEVCDRWISPDYDVDEIIDGAELVNEVRYARLEHVLQYKIDLNRPKDRADIDAMTTRLHSAIETERSLVVV